MRVPILILVVVLAALPGMAAQRDPGAIAAALRAALSPALPFPDAGPDGTPRDGSAEPVWTVRWPDDGTPRVEVLANPLNAGNRERALAVEDQVQQSVLRAQRRSQGDYEQALRDFQRTGRTSEIREITLRDDGVAGERYDAESQLTITAQLAGEDHHLEITTSVAPQLLDGIGGASAVLRIAAHVVREDTAGAEPSPGRYVAEQAWVVFGPVQTPAVTHTGHLATVGIRRQDGAAATPIVVVAISGNPELLEQVLLRADWTAVGRYGGG